MSIAKTELEPGIPVLDFLAVKSSIIPSKGEAKRLIQNGGVFINKIKVTDAAASVTKNDLLNNRYILVQKGKKNYYLVTFE
jgi:tyrosyl-tRNA synthetase